MEFKSKPSGISTAQSTVVSHNFFVWKYWDAIHGEGLKILVPKQMLRRLQIVLAPVKVGNASKNLIKQICQMLQS